METINSWPHSLAPDYTCHSEEFTDEEVPEQLSPSPQVRTSALVLALLPASAWQRLCPGLPKPTHQLSSKTSSGWEPHRCLGLPVTSKQQTHSSFPAWEKSLPLLPCQRAQMGCRFCFSFSPSPFEVHRLVLRRVGRLSQPPQLQLPSVLLTIFLWKGREEIKMFWYKVFWIILMPTVFIKDAYSFGTQWKFWGLRAPPTWIWQEMKMKHQKSFDT